MPQRSASRLRISYHGEQLFVLRLSLRLAPVRAAIQFDRFFFLLSLSMVFVLSRLYHHFHHHRWRFRQAGSTTPCPSSAVVVPISDQSKYRYYYHHHHHHHHHYYYYHHYYHYTGSTPAQVASIPPAPTNSHSAEALALSQSPYLPTLPLHLDTTALLRRPIHFITVHYFPPHALLSPVVATRPPSGSIALFHSGEFSAFICT